MACRKCTKRCLRVHGEELHTSLPTPLSFFKIMIGNFREAMACRKCTKRCLRVHGEELHTSLPTPLSFFKIMIGNFREAMFIPPMIACNLRDLVDQYICLRDSKGHDWRVKLSAVAGSLAFQEGWHDFVLGHTIGVGEFVVFKRITQMLFSAQIYGTSACERVHFHEQDEIGGRKRKRCKNGLYPKSSHLNRTHKIFKESEVHHGQVRDLVKNEHKIKAKPCDTSSVEILEKCTAEGVDDSSPPENVSHGEVPDDEQHINPKEEQKANMLNPKREVIHEETSEVDCLKGLNKDEHGPMSKQKIQREKKVHPFGHEAIDIKQEPGELMDNSFLKSHSPSEKAGEDMMALEAFDCKFLPTKKGLCHIADDNLMDELGGSRVTPIDFCEGEKDDSMCQVEEVAIPRATYSQCKDIPEVPCPEPITSCSEDEENLMVGQDHKAERRSGNAPGHVSIKEEALWFGDATQSVPDIPECHENSGIGGEESGHSGIVPDAVPKEHGKKSLRCLNRKDFQVKSETMDSTELPSRNSVNFSFSVSFKSQAWLELPQRLSFCPGKKKEERKIVMLRDSTMRLWPVMYLHSFSFVGFISGWEDFATAKNLQQGDHCRFEEVNESEPLEPMLQVSILKV